MKDVGVLCTLKEKGKGMLVRWWNGSMVDGKAFARVACGKNSGKLDRKMDRHYMQACIHTDR